MNDQIIDKELLAALADLDIDHFFSDDGLHEVKWTGWHDRKIEAFYDAWVCVTHNKLYYVDCILDAQI